jgi:hypothetical protein
VSSLILINAAARLLKDEDYPWGWGSTTPMHEAARLWGSANPAFMERFAPGMETHPDWEGFVRREARERRFGASPGMFVALQRVAMEIDVRDILPAVRCPTLVMHRKDNLIVDVGNGRYLAEHIPESKYIELPGADHYPMYDDADTVLDHVEEFMTGHLPTPVLNRILATILFTDIVGSTARAASIGDHAWKGTRSTRLGTASSRPSTDRRAASSARWRSETPSARLVLRSEPGCTPESAKSPG